MKRFIPRAQGSIATPKNNALVHTCRNSCTGDIKNDSSKKSNQR